MMGFAVAIINTITKSVYSSIKNFQRTDLIRTTTDSIIRKKYMNKRNFVALMFKITNNFIA